MQQYHGNAPGGDKSTLSSGIELIGFNSFKDTALLVATCSGKAVAICRRSPDEKTAGAIPFRNLPIDDPFLKTEEGRASIVAVVYPEDATAQQSPGKG